MIAKARLGVVDATCWALCLLAACRGGDEARKPGDTELADAPEARIEDVTEDHHGTIVADPYRWLEEQDSEEVAAWVDAQNARTQSFLTRQPARASIRSRLSELWSVPRWTAPERHGEWWIWQLDDGLRDQPVLYRGREAGIAGEVLLDPNSLSADGEVVLGSTAFSADGSYLAYAASTSGSDWMDWYVIEVATGALLDDHLEWSKFARAAWTHDALGFFYQRYPAPKEGEVYGAITRGPQLCYHLLGTPQSEDRVVYERPDQPLWSFGATVTHDGRHAMITIREGSDDRSRVAWIDLEAPGWPVRPFLMDLDAAYTFVEAVGGVALFTTDKDAANRRIVGIPIASPATVSEAWRVVVPEAIEAIEAAKVVGNQLIVTYLKDAHHVLRRFSLDGEPLGDIGLSELGAVGPVTGGPTDEVAYFTFETFTRPAEVHGFDLRTESSEVVLRPELRYSPDLFRVRQVGFASEDGTPLRMFVVYRSDIALDGTNPTLLYGYGGFGVSLTPRFSVEHLVFCERGGVLAQATLRGGGEYGPAWHEAGTRENKPKVFADFVAAARFLIRNDFTEASRLAIQGRSNGGLLVGVALTRHPELFGAAIPEVGVMDMLRYHRFSVGWAWEQEYGSSDEPDMFPVLRAYSPLHNIVPGTHYPPTLITTRDHDDRVLPGHSYKFAAALQASQGGAAPILLRVDRSAGHGASEPKELQFDEAVDRLTFLAATIGS